MLLVWLAVLGAWKPMFAQPVSGVKTLPGDYATFAAFVSDINANGIGAGGVILNINPGYTETAPAGGFVITATGTATNPIIIQAAGPGLPPTFTAPTPQTSGSLNDGIIKIHGGDYITLRGLALQENPSNTTTAATTNNMTEWGIALLYATTTDGCQNITIDGCTITLNRTYQNTWGIYANSTHSPTAVGTTATATGATGGNHNLTITRNNISNVNNGICVVGPTAATDHNNTLVIGGSPADANTITDYGTTGTFSSYVNVSGSVNGILVRNTVNYTISHNTITSSNGGVTSGTLRGVFVTSFNNAPTGTHTNAVDNNTISLRSGVAAGAILGVVIEASTSTATSSLSISNNDFNTFGHTVAGTAAITLISNAMAVLTTNINNNTFTNINVNTTGSFTFITNNVTRPANAVCNVNGNSVVMGFQKTGAGGTVQFYLSNSTSPATVTENNNNNNFSNISVTGATVIAGWQSSDGGSPTKVVTNNTFNNINGGTSAITVLNVSFSGSANVSNNTISNVTSTGSITGLASTAGNQNIVSNNIFGLNTSNATLNALAISGGTTQTISRNKIYDISSSNNLATVNGISVTSGTIVNINNNLIGNLQATNSTSTNAIRGIDLTTTGTCNVYYNTVYLNATSSSTTSFGTSCVSFSSLPTLDLRNNLLINLSTPAQAGLNNADNGQTAALRRSSVGINGVVPTNYATTSNNNLFYVHSSFGTNNYLVYVEGTGTGTVNRMNTLAAMKAFMANRDQLSVSENTNFASITGSDPDFLRPALPPPATRAESGAAAIAGLTDAYNGVGLRTGYPQPGQLNGGGFAPDIGAYEGDFGFVDGLPPTITYTPLGNTTSLTNRPFNGVIVTDPSGVNGAIGTRPRVYYKRSTDANTFVDNTSATNGWKFVEASNASSPFDFTIDYSLLNGPVTTGTIIQYFVVAQDLALTPNVGINSGIFASTPASVNLGAAQFPITGTINQYVIAVAYSGTINVGTSEAITSLTNAGGLFESLNSGVLVGNLTVNITSDLTAETGTHALNTLSEQPANSNFTLTIRPSGGVARTVSGSINNNALIRFNSVRNVTIDGLNAGGNALTIINNATTNPSVINIGSVGTNPSTNVTITNTTIINGSNTASAIVVGDAANLGSAGYFNNITLSNNNVQRASTGMFLNAVATPGNGLDILVNNNTMNTSGANAIRRIGIHLQGVSNGAVTNNTLGNFEAATAENDHAIWLAAGTAGVSVTGNTISNLALTAASNSPIAINVTAGVANSNIFIGQNNISGVTSAGTQVSTGIQVSGATGGVIISENTITNIKNTNTVGWGAAGIRLNSTLTAANIQVYNNSISDVAAVGFGGSSAIDNGYGIIIDAGGGYGVYFNSVNMNTNQTATNGLPAAFNVTSGVTTPNSIDVRNNVFVNSQTAGNTERYAIYSGAAASVYSNIDHNNYFTATGANLGFLGSARSNLAAWQTATGKDVNSVSVDPNFTSPTNLLPTNLTFNNAGTPIVGITTDITGATRSATTPDMGAYEFNCPPTVTFTPGAGALPAGTIGVAYNQAITQTGLIGTLSWSFLGALPPGLTLNPTTGLISGTPTATGTYNFTVQVSVGGCSASVNYSITVNCAGITITPPAGALPAGTIGVAYNQTITQTGLPGTPTWSISSGTLPPGLTLNSGTGVISGTPTATLGSPFNFTVQVTDGTCTATQAYSIAVSCPTITFNNTTASNATVGVAYSLDASVTGNTQPVTYSVSPALPAGLTLNTSTGQITGTPTATAPPTTYTVTATQGVCVVTQNYTFAVVCAGITISPATLPAATLGVAYSQTITQTGLSGTPTWSISSGTLPPGLTLNSGTGVISGTPTVLGTSNFTVQVSNGTCTQTQAYSITVNPSCPTITVSPVTLPNGIVGVSYSQTVTATGGTAPYTFAVTSGSLPAGLTLNASTGVISGTVTSATTSSFTITATDASSNACTGSTAYSVSFTVVNGPIIELSGNLDFGDVPVLQSAKKTLKIRNIGNAPLNVNSLALPPIVFLASFGGIIEAGGSREVEVIFTPIAPTTYTGQLLATSNAVAGTPFIDVKGKGVVPTSIQNNAEITLKAYPNPTSNLINLKVTNAPMSNCKITVTDMLGRIVLESNASLGQSNHEIQLNLENLADGVYLIQLSHSKGKNVVQVVKK
jgi:hypothetical protein